MIYDIEGHTATMKHLFMGYQEPQMNINFPLYYVLFLVGVTHM